MAVARKANAQWQGDLKGGSGELSFGSGAYTGSYTFASRFESGDGTNPEELLAAAHAACFSMSLSNILAGAGHTPASVRTEAVVTLDRVDGAPAITKVELTTVGDVPDIDEAEFQEHAAAAKAGCPVSKLFASAEIVLDATLSA
jgi:lipoyl-dependent peroxiredoxin